jgi:hypothetical protein
MANSKDLGQIVGDAWSGGGCQHKSAWVLHGYHCQSVGVHH